MLLGVTGSVAAVKGPKLALRLAKELGCDVKLILTRTVEQYFWADDRAVALYDGDSWRELSSAVAAPPGDLHGEISLHHATEEWEGYRSLDDSVLHIDLRNWADLCLIAPLSAHTLAKIANGLCDDLLSCCLRAWDYGQRSGSKCKPVVLAPAMNTAMWDHPLTRNQLNTIKNFAIGRGEQEGVLIVEPAVKTLACGDVGAGALAGLDDILTTVSSCLASLGFSGCNARDATGSSKKALVRKALLRAAKKRFNELQKATDVSKLAAPISPSGEQIIDAMLPHLNLGSDSLVVDLGCGDARWLVAATQFSDCKCIGIDIDARLVRLAKTRISELSLTHKIDIRLQDVFEFARGDRAISAADVIVVYLFREAVLEIGDILRGRLRKGTQILSVGFGLTGFPCIFEGRVGGIRVYLYMA